jgi:peptidyl-prolyl cis-trans isomerase SurA
MNVILLWCAVASAQEATERRVDAVVAAVNGEAITVSALRLEMTLNNVNPNDLSERRQTLDTLIDRRLYIQHARNFTFITDAKVNENIEKIAKTFPSRESFLEDLARGGMTLDDVRNQMRESLMLLQLEVRNFRPQIAEVSPTDVEAYHVSHRDEFTVPEQVRLAQILVATPLDASPSVVEAASATAASLRAAIASGAETFDSLVAKAPPGVTVVAATTLRAVNDYQPELQKVLQHLQPNDLSEPIATSQGVFVIRLLERRPSVVQPIADVRAAIVAKIEAERVRAVMEAWIREQRARADIRILEPELAATTRETVSSTL